MYESIIHKLDKIIKLLEVNYKQQKMIVALLSKEREHEDIKER